MKFPLKLSRSPSSSPPSSTPPSPAASSPSPTSSNKKLLIPSALRNIPFPSLSKIPSTRKQAGDSPAAIIEMPSPTGSAINRRNSGSSRTPSFKARGKLKVAQSSSSSASPPKLQRVPSAVLQEIKQVFKQFDANGDGKISVDELREVLRSLGEDTSREEVALMVDEVDADGDGYIDLQEFVDLNKRWLDGAGEMASQDELTAAFEIFDLDKNGWITAEELAAVLSRLGGIVGQRSSVEDCRRMIRGVDRKGVGYVDFDDFKLMMMSPNTDFLRA